MVVAVNGHAHKDFRGEIMSMLHTNTHLFACPPVKPLCSHPEDAADQDNPHQMTNGVLYE